MKQFKLAVLIAALIMGAMPLFAQPPGGPGQGGPRRMMTEEDVKNRVDNLAQTLEMTAEQKEKIMKYEIDSYKKRQVEMQKFQGDREAMREYFTKSREERDKLYEEVLTEDQMTKYREIQEQRRQEMQDRRQQNPQQNPSQDRPDRGRG